jgi:fatty-acyl-CoA synthase
MTSHAVSPRSDDHGSTKAAWLRALTRVSEIERDPTRLIVDVLRDHAVRQPNAPALVAREGTLSFGALAKRIDAYAGWTAQNGLGPGDCVALLAPTSLDYLPAWLGASSVGAAVALLNPLARGAGLSHALATVRPKFALVDERLRDDLTSAGSELGFQLPCADLAEAGRTSATPLLAPAVLRPGLDDRALYIFTSGTTGLPKAAIVSHRRVLTWSFWFSGLIGVERDDRMYDCLPLHHSVGGVVAPCATLVGGGSVVLRERFSAAAFWPEVRDHGCTLVQYIGELCRYLLQTPPDERDARHAVRLACGNGLRPDVWTAFQERFGVPRILEFYASTEGNLSLYNVEGRVGAIGRLPSFAPRRAAIALVKIDEDGRPLRRSDGLCLLCEANEAGEAVSAIGRDSAGTFEGYTSEEQTETKILRDVRKAGDAWFRTGDLMRKDTDGFFYFVDRLGDTFRWKGENVSTLEVAQTLCGHAQVREALVYGVQTPGAEGRAGMALIAPGPNLSLNDLADHLRRELPSYARPLFLRLQDQFSLTDTFKYKKSDLQDDGFDPRRVADPLFVWDAEAKTYVSIDSHVHEQIMSGRLRI